MSDTATGVRDEGYDDLLDAIAEGAGYYLECENGHGSLPPRRVCPHCGAPELTETPLPATVTIESFTVVHVPTPQFEADAPYVTAIAEYGPGRLTGIVRGRAPEDVEIGDRVVPTVEQRETTEDRLLVFRPAE
ncbi:MAG: Zn-ribbon domain-containing OB-fold protein [Bradymonadaceae bacterium]